MKNNIEIVDLISDDEQDTTPSANTSTNTTAESATEILPGDKRKRPVRAKTTTRKSIFKRPLHSNVGTSADQRKPLTSHGSEIVHNPGTSQNFINISDDDAPIMIDLTSHSTSTSGPNSSTDGQVTIVDLTGTPTTSDGINNTASISSSSDPARRNKKSRIVSLIEPSTSTSASNPANNNNISPRNRTGRRIQNQPISLGSVEIRPHSVQSYATEAHGSTNDIILANATSATTSSVNTFPSTSHLTAAANAPPKTLSLECSICLEIMQNISFTFCGHVFCYPCITGWLQNQPPNKRNCPICRKKLTLKQIKRVYT